MRRKVSLWIVILLVAALAATTTATVVLATDDRDGREVADEALPVGPHGQWQMPFGAERESGWYSDRHDEVLPWFLFAIATGAAVGMLIAWGPWRTSPATPGDGAGATGESAAARGDVATYGGGIIEAAPTEPAGGDVGTEAAKSVDAERTTTSDAADTRRHDDSGPDSASSAV